jgi:protein-S-isoprenylcysteine O-methyltransferase Ste14
MADDLTFRILFLALYGLFLIPRGYYRFIKPRQEKEEAGEADRADVGKIQITLTVIILGSLIASILYMLGLPWMDWFQIVQYPLLLRGVGALLVLVMIPLVAWIHRELDRQYSAVLEIQSDHQLITTGPYKRVRHPMYTVLILFFFGLSLVSANLLVIIFALLLMAAFPFWVRVEEEKMIEVFGEEYIEYMKRTGRFFPALRKRNLSL